MMAVEEVDRRNVLLGMDFSDKSLSEQDKKFIAKEGDFRKGFTPNQQKQFEHLLCRSINHNIRENEKRSKKANDRWRAIIDGKDPDDVE